jgi:fringe protein
VLQVSGWQERAPRSISKDYDGINSNVVLPGAADPGAGHERRNGKFASKTNSSDTNYNNVVLATGTSRPVGTQLSDVFISVKTTRNYHKWRLPVILKTWFQLAKDQVRHTCM